MSIADKNSPSTHLSFRKDIEGLRAVAILLVVASHAGVPWLEGGFVGVDVFFVLSGYLISGLLIKELNRDGSINFPDFYSRRLKRLLPALMVMTSLVSVFVGLMLSPLEQINQALSASSVSYWISNFFFSLSDLGYFSPEASDFVFLHTWSLSVEEQFYLIWPVLILALFNVGKQKEQGNLLRTYIVYLVMIFVAGLLLCVYLSYIRPLWGFFMMPSRAWQFALGGLVFVIFNRELLSPTKSHIKVIPTVTGYAGIALILFSSFFFSEAMSYPWLWGLFPSVGAACLLISGLAKQESLVTRCLASALMQLVGKVSYSWYLWHWPVFILGKSFFPEAGVAIISLLVILSFLLAMLTLHIVEIPLRSNPILSARPLITISLSILIMSVGFTAAKVWENKAEEWANSPQQFVYQEVKSDLPEIYEMGCDEWINSARVKICSFGSNNPDKRALLLGDSIVAQWFSALAKPLMDDGWQFLVLTKSACPMIDEPIYYSRIGQEYSICSDWRDAVMQQLSVIRPGIIFTGSASDYNYTAKQWFDGFSRIASQLSNHAEQVYVIPGSYRLPFDGPSCLARRKWQSEFIANLNDCYFNVPESYDAVVNEALKNIADNFDNMGILDLNSLICPDKICAAEMGGQIVYRDNQHISDNFVRKSTDHISELIEQVKFITD